MDTTTFFDKLYAVRDEFVFYWHNPAIFKEKLMTDHVLFAELILIAVVILFLLYALFKPAKSETKSEIKAPAPQSQQKQAQNQTQKTFSKALSEQQMKDPPLSRPRPHKKHDAIPLQELSEEEERALKEAMVVAGKQALAEVSGEPHQTEIFQNNQAVDVAKKIFAGPTRSTEEAEQEQNPPKLPTPSEFIMIYFMAPRSHPFEADELFETLRNFSMELNDDHVFEYLDEDGAQFYVASAIKPGYFDLHRANYAIPGISFVLDLATSEQPQKSFNKMLESIYQISQILRGDILDEQRQRLTQVNIHQYLARIKSLRKPA